MNNCTCSHICHGMLAPVLHHDWQLKAWKDRREYLPCTDYACTRFYYCDRPITQEDMLCDCCRESGCVSILQTGAVRNLLLRLSP